MEITDYAGKREPKNKNKTALISTEMRDHASKIKNRILL